MNNMNNMNNNLKGEIESGMSYDDCAIESGMSYDDLKGAIESGMILHDKILIEDGIDLNTNTNVCDDDGSKLLARVLAASNLLNVKYYLNVKYKNQNTFGFNNKFIATNKNTYYKLINNKFINEFNTYDKLINDKLKSISKSSNPFSCVCSDMYIVDDLKENYVCVGFKDDYSKSYTFKIV